MRNTILKKGVAIVLLFLCSFTNLFAVSDQFNINLSVVAGTDTIAPSTPTGLSATAVSSSQIDLSWTASTDNVGVTGYRIYRDSSLITTVTGTSYSDSGLSASTLYTYTVSAIDAAANESAQSASSSATTFAGSSTGSGGGGRSQVNVPQIYNVSVYPNQTGVRITWNTSVPTRDVFGWGQNSNLELGNITETLFGVDHSVTLSNLKAGTAYQFGIIAVNGYGSSNTYAGNFQTLSLVEGNVNARNFTATAGDTSIYLKWVNPSGGNFEEVRIVKSDSFYPSNPNDGEVIYEGTSQAYEDTSVSVGTRYYYSLFTKNKDGEYSSGLIADARIKLPGEIDEQPDTLGNLPEAQNVDPIIRALTFLDFDFIQNGVRINDSSIGETVTIDGAQNLTVSLDYRKVPEVLKSIAVTLGHPSDNTKTFSFLLRVNKDKTAYTATIAPLGDSGTYSVHIAIVDYKNRGLKNIFGSLLASAAAPFTARNESMLMILQIIEENLFLLTFLLILAICFLWSLKNLLDSQKHHPVSR